MNNSPNKNLLFLIEPILIILPISLLFSSLISELLILIIISIFFVSVRKDELIKIFNNKIILFMIVLYLYLILNYFVNISKDPSFTRSIPFIRFIFYVIALSYFLNKDYIKSKRIFFYWTVIVFLVCLDLQLQNITGKNIFGYEAIRQGNFTRLGGFLDDELKISYLLNSFFVVSLGSTFTYQKINKKNKLLALLLTGLVIYSVYATAERSNFVCLLFFTIIFFIFSKLRNYLFFMVILLIPIIIINFSYIKSNSKIERMFSENTKLIKSSLSFNVDKQKNFLYKNNNYFPHYSTAWEIFKDYPTMGVGLKNFRKYCNNEIYDEKIYPQYRNTNCSTHPHNLFFEIISELGILGVVVFFGFFGYFFYKSLRVSLKNKDLFLFGNTIFLMTYFIPFLPRGSFFTNWNAMIFWTIFAISIHLIDKKKHYA